MPQAKFVRRNRLRRRRKSQNEKRLNDEILRDIARAGFLAAWQSHLPEIAALQRNEQMTSHEVTLQIFEWMEEDPEISAHFDNLTDFETEALMRDLENDQPISPNDSELSSDFVGRGVFGMAEDPVDEFDEILESTGRPVRFYRRKKFRNWGRTVENRPKHTFVPHTIQGVQNIVRWAKNNDRPVRAAGYRHSWSDLFGDDRAVLISLLPLKFVERLPSREPKLDPENELQGIQMVGHVNEGGVRKGLCKIGAGTTNEMLREWLLEGEKEDWKEWTLPLNVIMVEITFGGSNGPICHGAGINTQTLSDLVHEIQFVNVNGDLQTVSDPEQLKVAAGCFGMLGVVVSLTLKLDPMSFAEMKPIDKRVGLAIPPPQGFVVPEEVDMAGITAADLDAAQVDFENRCENHYYSEWFWFAFNDDCWVNTWNNTGTLGESEDFPSPLLTKVQEGLTAISHIMNKTLFKILPGRWQAKMMSSAAMLGLPNGETIVAPMIDALHFQRGIQNMRVMDIELEIPIPARADDPNRPDWSVCQRAWWAAIASVYQHEDTPMRLTLEMRITGDSNMVMAPQHGNRFGTCSIEVLTTPNVKDENWAAFKQEMVDEWTSYTDAAGNKLNVRPHWAKEWQGLEFNGKPVIQFLKEDAYRDRIPEYKAGLAAIAQEGGYTLADLQQRFSNPLLDDIFEDVFN